MTKYATNEALESIDLESLLTTEGVDYKTAWGRSGKQLNLRSCPFCGNNNHKVYINADTGLGNCFAGSCSQKTFNKWQFLKGLYDLGARDLMAKIDFLAEQQGWRPIKTKELPAYDPSGLNLPPCKPICELPATPKYLQDRGINVALATKFDLRYCEEGWFEVEDPDGKIIKQSYAGRIILPIYDIGGHLVSFQGRDATGKAEKRYLFPPMYASTGAHLYNIQNWRAGYHTHAVLCEGPFDVIGVQRALDELKTHYHVCPLGTFGMQFSISKSGQADQMGKLLELKTLGLRTVVMMWDNERTALEAAIKAAQAIARFGFRVELAKLDGAKDPGEATPLQVYQALTTTHHINSPLAAMLLAQKLAI